MNPFTYIWLRYKDSGWHIFHQELWRGWQFNAPRDKFFDAGLLALGFLIMLFNRQPIGVGYFLLCMLVAGQGWINNCLHRDLRVAHGAFLRVMRILHEERKAIKLAEEDSDVDSGA